LAIENLAEQFTGTITKNEAIERLSVLITHKENRFSYEYALVIEENDNILGVVTAYPENIIDDLTFNTLELSRKLSWQINIEIQNRLLNDKEAPKGTYYIDNIAINKNYRSKGYATFLIEVIENNAVKIGYDVISILADINNPRAKFLYEKLGYKASGNVLANGHNYTVLMKNL